MAHDNSTRLYRSLYRKLLGFYPGPFRERFGEGMEQTFNDLCREREDAGKGLLAFTLWTFVETSAGILRERRTFIMNKNIISIALVTVLILLLLFVTMQFTDEMNWDLFDFVFAGALLFGTGLTYELIVRKAGNTAYRIAVGTALAGAFMLIWADGAVGLIGSEDEPINLLFLGVLAVGVIGSIIGRFRPLGMARALFAAALAQALIAVVALITGMHRLPGISVSEIVNMNGFFVLLFLASAGLFREAARKRTPSGGGPEA